MAAPTPLLFSFAWTSSPASVDTDTADCRHPVRVRDIYLGFASAETVCVTCGQAFDPEREYGVFPDGIRARPESELARRERKRGISVPALECAALAVWGDWEERGSAIAAFYGVEELRLAGKSHWDLVLDDDAIAAVRAWLEAQPSRSTG